MRRLVRCFDLLLVVCQLYAVESKSAVQFCKLSKFHGLTTATPQWMYRHLICWAERYGAAVGASSTSFWDQTLEMPCIGCKSPKRVVTPDDKLHVPPAEGTGKRC